MQKVIGIIGGIAPPSTIDYYQKIITGFQETGKTRHYPSLLINSIDMTRMLDLVANKEYDALVDYLSDEIQKLKDGGADFGAIASNTPHIVFEQLRKRSSIPLISIVDATAVVAKKTRHEKAWARWNKIYHAKWILSNWIFQRWNRDHNTVFGFTELHS